MRNLSKVALRKESVDRNFVDVLHRQFGAVALRKESVDRNMGVGTTRDSFGVSLSARRAWIEINNQYFAKELPSGRSPQGERG